MTNRSNERLQIRPVLHFNFFTLKKQSVNMQCMNFSFKKHNHKLVISIARKKKHKNSVTRAKVNHRLLKPSSRRLELSGMVAVSCSKLKNLRRTSRGEAQTRSQNLYSPHPRGGSDERTWERELKSLAFKALPHNYLDKLVLLCTKSRNIQG